jgi:NAD(P)-dependent dehydrogenase (short-subunit alcohol dehydrogenase family)/acyl carrier protein
VFVPSWRAGRPRLGPSRSNGVTLVFQSDRGLDHGGQPEQAIVVLPGDGFRRTPDGYLIDPARGTDWEALHADLDRRGIRPATLLYLWSYLGVPADRAAAHDAAVRCGQQLLACVQTFLRPGDEALPELVAVTRQLYRVTGEEQVCYPAALTASIVATLARELPQARVRHIDLPGGSDESDAFTLLQARRDEGAATSAAWRRGRPYLRAITPTADSAAGRDALRRGGRYLVTGGCGGVGGQILTDLADRYSAQLLVVGRRPLDADPDLAAAWRRLDAPGRDVRYRAADVVDAGALRAAVSEVEEQWDGPLDGVIHLADSYRLRAIADEDTADWDPDRLAKVGGTLNLLDIVRDRPGARLIVFSSLLGSLAFGNCAAYGAGNAFADALVEHLAAAGYVDATSVAWGLWHGIGINADNPYEAASARRGVLSLSPDQGRILARLALRRPGGVYQVGLNAAASETRGMALTECPLELERPVLISDAVTDLPALPPLVDPFGTTAPLSVEDRVAPDGGGSALSPEEDEVLQVIRAILAPLVDRPIELARSIHAYGISSIHMLQIHAQLEDALDLDIPKSALFEHPTIARLVAYLADRV